MHAARSTAIALRDFVTKAQINQSLQDHRKIARAIQDGDEAAAAHAMLLHVPSGSTGFSEFLARVPMQPVRSRPGRRPSLPQRALRRTRPPRSIDLPGASHNAPIPAAARVANVLCTSAIAGKDPRPARCARTSAIQARLAFANLQAVFSTPAARRSRTW